MRDMVNNNKKIKIFARDKFKCNYCGVEGVYFVRGKFLRRGKMSKRGTVQVFTKDLKLLTIDHIIPKVEDGTDACYNLQTLCYDCNVKKGGKLYKFEKIEDLDQYDLIMES
jgi:5-methylcytosine-specific restriction endonuclease McrA